MRRHQPTYRLYRKNQERRVEYYDGETQDISDEYFNDGAFISEMKKLGKYTKHKTHNGEFMVYKGYEYDYRREIASK